MRPAAVHSTIATPDGVQLAVDDAGAGAGPAIVLLHGLTATRRHVVMGSRALERGGRRVIAYDARGHGQSSPAASPAAYRYDELAADLAAVLDVLGLGRVVLVGASMGAHTALRLAADQPERVAALAVITPAYDPVDVDGPARLTLYDALADALRAGDLDRYAELMTAGRVAARWRAPVARGVRQRMQLHAHPQAVADALRATPRSRPFADLHTLTAIDCPTVVVGSRDEPDPSHPLALAREYADLIPGARLVVEDDGASPIAWRGLQLSNVIAQLARAAG